MELICRNIAAVLAIVLAAVMFPGVRGSDSFAPASDGITIDQGIACVLMLVALVLTYIIH